MPISKLHSISAVANLLAHNNITPICYCGQISLPSAAVNCSFSDNLTPLESNIYFAGDGTIFALDFIALKSERTQFLHLGLTHFIGRVRRRRNGDALWSLWAACVHLRYEQRSAERRHHPLVDSERRAGAGGVRVIYSILKYIEVYWKFLSSFLVSRRGRNLKCCYPGQELLNGSIKRGLIRPSARRF